MSVYKDAFSKISITERKTDIINKININSIKINEYLNNREVYTHRNILSFKKGIFSNEHIKEMVEGNPCNSQSYNNLREIMKPLSNFNNFTTPHSLNLNSILDTKRVRNKISSVGNLIENKNKPLRNEIIKKKSPEKRLKNNSCNTNRYCSYLKENLSEKHKITPVYTNLNFLEQFVREGFSRNRCKYKSESLKNQFNRLKGSKSQFCILNKTNQFNYKDYFQILKPMEMNDNTAESNKFSNKFYIKTSERKIDTSLILLKETSPTRLSKGNSFQINLKKNEGKLNEIKKFELPILVFNNNLK